MKRGASAATRSERPRPRVRPARRADRAAIAALWASADRQHAELHPAYFRGDGTLDPRIAGALELADGSRELFVADVGGLAVGFVLVELLEPSRVGGAAIGRRGHIDALVVADGARRSGIGRQLVEAAIAWAKARRAEELLLTVWAGNEEAERFYETIGLKTVSRVMRVGL